MCVYLPVCVCVGVGTGCVCLWFQAPPLRDEVTLSGTQAHALTAQKYTQRKHTHMQYISTKEIAFLSNQASQQHFNTHDYPLCHR